MKFSKKLIYISLFAILYLIVAFSSLYHAVEFFGLANNMWMAVILAFAFEVGQAAVLFALLTSNKDRGKVMPWVLMTMFTLVQVLGNVYSSYKHIINNSVENLKYFKEPIFIWTQLPDDQATVIITYLVGGLLPISALLLTSMVTNYLSDDQQSLTIKEENIEAEEVKEEEKPEIENDNEENKKIDTNIHEDNTNTEENQDNDQKDIEQIDNEDINISEEPISIEKIHELNETYDSGEISENDLEETEETGIKGSEDSKEQRDEFDYENKVISYEDQNEKEDNKKEDQNEIVDNKKEETKKESHFINLNK